MKVLIDILSRDGKLLIRLDNYNTENFRIPHIGEEFSIQDEDYRRTNSIVKNVVYSFTYGMDQQISIILDR